MADGCLCSSTSIGAQTMAVLQGFPGRLNTVAVWLTKKPVRLQCQISVEQVDSVGITQYNSDGCCLTEDNTTQRTLCNLPSSNKREESVTETIWCFS